MMAIYYELWHLPSGNLVLDFDTEAKALRFVADMVQEHGPAYGEKFMLGARYDDETADETSLPTWEGQHLVDRALAAADLPHVPA